MEVAVVVPMTREGGRCGGRRSTCSALVVGRRGADRGYSGELKGGRGSGVPFVLGCIGWVLVSRALGVSLALLIRNLHREGGKLGKRGCAVHFERGVGGQVWHVEGTRIGGMNLTNVGIRLATLFAVPLAFSPLYREQVWMSWSPSSALADSGVQKDVRGGFDGAGGEDPLELRCGAYQIPEKTKDNGGEDAFFIERNAVGVYDGVGGWKSYGIDAGIYARALASKSAMEVRRKGPGSVVEALRKAAKENKNLGSATACTVGLVDGNRLRGINLGDSGLLVLRGTSTVFRSAEQQVRFNFPFQLGTSSTNSVEDGDKIEVAIEDGDVVILATDGVFDNLYDSDLADLAGQAQQDRPDEVAQRIANAALVRAESSTRDGPFAVHAREAGIAFYGGKTDDITVVFCRACVEGKLELNFPKSKM